MKNILKKLTALLLVMIISTSLFGCAGNHKQNTNDYITITDTVGREVNVPTEVESISCICPFSGFFIVMFGHGNEITSLCNNMARSTLLNKFCPSIKNAVVVKNSGSVNAEELLNLKTDLIFVNEGTYQDSNERAKLDALNIPYVVIGFSTLQEQMDAVKVIGSALNQNEKAEKYITWYQSIINDVNEKLADYNEEEIDLYHAVNEATRTDYNGSICAEWIDLCKVNNVSINASLSIEGEKAYTTLEQIYQWNPQIIICNEPGVCEYILTDEKWAGLECVRNENVYQMPVGMSRMGHPTSPETPLALIWLCELLYPDIFDYDVKKEFYSFYKDFYDFELDDDTLNAIIQGDNMRIAKEDM